jgi:lysyl-tRNA synthetase class 2
VSSDDLNFVLKARREKLERLRALGVEPFAYGFERTHSATEAVAHLGEAAEAGPVRVAGRLVAWRGHGRTAFAHLADQAGRIQLYFRRDALGDDRFLVLDQLDIGDVIGVAGPLFRTRTGEATIRVESFDVLA